MPMQNRVTPWGEIVATPARGTFMGNRGGRLHDGERRLGRRRWATKAWLICVLSFRDRWSPVMPAHGYTRLFFLDEATALAAGHRPCAECRRAAFNAFAAVAAADFGGPPRAPVLDARLHEDRLAQGCEKATFAAAIGDLPDGTFVVTSNGAPALLWRDRLLAWSAAGYGASRPVDRTATARVLTPRLTVAALGRGYVPEVHVTAGDHAAPGLKQAG